MYTLLQCSSSDIPFGSTIKKAHRPLRTDSPEGEEHEQEHHQEQQEQEQQQDDAAAAEGSASKPPAAEEPELTRSLSSGST